MILQALDRYYDRMAARGEAEPQGWAKAPIHWAVELSPNGEPLAVLQLLDPTSKKPRPQVLSVPAPVKRTIGIAPNHLWDKTAYVLGRKVEDPEASDTKHQAALKRTAEEHAAFKKTTLELIGASNDPGLTALRRFLEAWTPEQFDAPPFSSDMLDGNIVFRLAGELGFIHERPAARALLRREESEPGPDAETCLISGAPTTPQRLHPSIKGVVGAQVAGASLVSFNLDAFKSYGREQGANAPTSAAAAERYGAALNAMLAFESRNRLRRGIGDATVVFWADASGAEDEQAAHAAEALFAQVFGAGDDDADADDGDVHQAAKVRDALVGLAQGRPQTVEPNLKPGVRFHVLGLSPNAARLAVRFWLSDSFEHFAEALLQHMQDLAIEPTPRGWSSNTGMPTLGRLLVKTTAVQEKFENVPPLIGGDLARAVLGAAAYPRTWLAGTIMRLRAGDDPSTGWHAAAIKACLNRDARLARSNKQSKPEDLPVALDPDYHNNAYQLGRLFAVIEAAQRAALGKVNASVADRYYASASATPARVFASLLRNARNHVSDLKKRGSGGWIEIKLNEIIARLPPDLPRTLKLEDQGRFAVGYYHERATRPAKSTDGEATEDHDNDPATAGAEH